MKNARYLPNLIEYGFLRTAEIVCRLMPRNMALACGAAMGRLMQAAGVYGRVIDTNLRHVGYWTDDEQREIKRKLYRNMGRYIADFLHARPGSLPYYPDPMPLVNRVQGRGKGVLVVLGHFGNWEALASAFGQRADGLHAVSMPMNNPLVEKWLTRRRAATGVVEITKHKAARRILTTLRKNKLVAVLIDQNARRQGTMVPFLGKEASTVRTVAGLLQKTGCGVVLVYALLEDDNRYRIHIEEGRDLGMDPADQEAFITAYQREHNDVLSGWIREHPEHWFGWFHKRYKGSISYR